MNKVNLASSKYIAAALGAALLLANPAAAQSFGGYGMVSLAKTSAILGGQPSALAMIEAQQNPTVAGHRATRPLRWASAGQTVEYPATPTPLPSSSGSLGDGITTFPHTGAPTAQMI